MSSTQWIQSQNNQLMIQIYGPGIHEYRWHVGWPNGNRKELVIACLIGSGRKKLSLKMREQVVRNYDLKMVEQDRKKLQLYLNQTLNLISEI